MLAAIDLSAKALNYNHVQIMCFSIFFIVTRLENLKNYIYFMFFFSLEDLFYGSVSNAVVFSVS